MAKFRIEIQITILALIIAGAVITSGYLGYKNLSQIVNSIHQAAIPDDKLFLIKDIAANLSEIENDVRLYVLTDEDQNLKPYENLQQSVNKKLESLRKEILPDAPDKALMDSIISLSSEKLEIWGAVLKLHQTSKGLEPEFSQIYSKIEEPKIDTVAVEHKKKGFLRNIFGTRKVEIDTTYVTRELKKDEIKQEIESLQTEIQQKGQQNNILESRLIENNLKVDEKLNSLILKAEQNESDKLVEKTTQADRLSALTYKRLTAFSVAAVILLLLVLFLMYNYIRKSRRYQRMLKEAKAGAEAFALAKERFAANVSHEVRTPINAIYGLSEQLLQTDLSPVAREQLLVLARSANHLKNIVNDTLDFSKIQANKLKFDNIHFSPLDVFNEVMAILRSEARNKELELKFRTTGPIANALIGDPLRLKQILLNIINNSLKFTNTGYILFQAEMSRPKGKEYILKMMVEDTGIGISKEDQQYIFDEFVQAESQSAKKYSGTGLGLAIVKKLVEIQGGKISIESEKGAGTRIFIEIPYNEGDPEQIQGIETSTISVPASFKKLTVLVVDDEEFNRFLFKTIFQKWGTTYQEATTGDEAMEACRANDFDIVFMDLNMPGTNGLEAAATILRNKPDMKIIAITASNDKTDLDACKKAGMVGYLTKPFSETDLFNTVIEKLGIKNEPLLKPVMNSGSNGSPEIDLNELKRLSNFDEAFFIEMLEMFIQSSEKEMKTIEEKFIEEDFKAIAETAHKLVAPCRHIRAKKLYPLLQELEYGIKNNRPRTDIYSLIKVIKTELAVTNSYIQNFLNHTQADAG